MIIQEGRGSASQGNKRIVQLLGLALVLAFLIAIRVLVALDLPHSYENSFLLGFLNTLFLGITPIIIAYVAMRVYTKSRSISFFLIGSGLLIFGLGSIAAGWVNPLPGGPNMTVTIHNTCACIGSIVILAGAVMSLSAPVFRRAPVSTGKLAAVYAGIVIFVTLFSIATLEGMVPPFFIPGTGPTILRQIILEDAVVFFAISSVLFMYTYQKRRADFFFWISVSLALIATGLLAVFFQPSVGSLIGWVGRTAQYLGCVFALYAVLIVRQAATVKGIPLDEVIANFFADAEQSYKQLVETASDAIVTFDEDYRVLMWNSAAEKMFGYRRDEAIGSSFPDLATDGRDIAVIKNDDDGISGSQVRVLEPVEIIARRKDGTLFPVELTISRRMQDGRLIRTCILRDLTERKRAERKLAHLAAIVEYSDEAIIGKTLNGDITSWNTGAERTYGYSAQEVIGKNISLLVPPGYPDDTREILEEIGKGELVIGYETLRRKKDGGQIEVMLTVSPVRDEQDRLIGASSIGHDITGRKRMEEALRVHAEIERNMSEAAYLIRVSDAKIVYSNPAFERMLGYGPGELIGMHVSIVNAPVEKTPEETASEIISSLAQTGSWAGEVLNLRKDGTTVWCHANVITFVHPVYGKVWLSIHQDITDRKKAEEAFRESNAYLNNLFDYANAPIIVWDTDYVITRFNHAFENLTLRSEQEVIGQQLDILFPEESKDRSLLSIKKTLEGERWEIVEIPILVKDGSVRTVLWNSANILDPDGGIISTIAQGVDITDRKVAEEALRDSERILHQAQKVSRVGHFITDIKTGTWKSSPVLDEIFGIDASFVRNIENWGMIVAPEYRQKMVDYYYNVLDEKTRFDMDYKVIRPVDGQERWVWALGEFDYDSAGNPVRQIGTIQDITERKVADETLRETKDYLESLFTYANAPIIVWNPAFEITRFNHAFEELTGRTGQQVIGKRLEILFPPESCDASMDLIQKALAGERWEIEEIPILNVISGEVRIVLWNSANILTTDGTTVLATIAQGQDITERKELENETKFHEQELMQFSTALATANKKLNLLSSITRHDINNQLMSVNGFLELLHEKVPDPGLLDYFTRIARASSRISAMIRFTKEYEQIGVNAPAWQDCHRLIDTATKEAPLGNVMVKNDLPAGLEVFADQLITRVFYNLMDNAVRYGGKITTIRFSALDRNGDRVIACEDDGDGIPADEKDKIFDRGFGKNTGLGLALSREILDITGITIVETGEPGKGARFEMMVPKGAWRMAGWGA